MRKIVLIVLSVFIIVAAGSFTIAWFIQASQIKKSIEQSIARINANQKYITYDSIETSGFPKDVVVSIERPRFSGRADLLLNQIRQTLPGYNPASAPLPELQEDISLSGALILSINALSDHYGVATQGDLLINSTLNGQKALLVSKPSGGSTCQLVMQHGGSMLNNLWNYQNLIRDSFPAFAHDFRQLDCAFSASSLTAQATGALLSNSEASRLYVTSAPLGDQQNLRVYVKSDGTEVTPAGDKMLSDYMKAFSPNSGATNYAASGKQVFEADFTYNAPSDLKTNNASPVDIALNKFDVTNALFHFGMNFHVANNVTGDTRNTALTYRLELNPQDGYEAALGVQVQNFIRQLYVSNDPTLQAMRPYIQKYTPEQLYAVVTPVIPNLHGLGTLVAAADMNYQGGKDMKNGNFTLSNFELSAAPYGITAKGDAKTASAQITPSGNLALNCSNCLHLADDAGDYAQRLQKVTTTINPAAVPSHPVTPQLISGIKNFLQTLARPADGNNASFSYAIDSDGVGGITVNGKRIDEVMTLFNQTIAPALHGAAPAPTGH